nr:unnamed protein product [Digitaria exilis]
MQADGEVYKAKEHFVLVHGAGHGAWCWFKLASLLQASGHRVSCVDLAGAAGSLVDSNDVTSFDQYDAPLVDFMAALPDGGHKDSTLASILLRPWPAALSTARFGCINEGVQSTVNLVRRVYIKTANDRMVKLEQQDAMIRRWPPSVVMVMDSDHSPFFSAPEHLLELILKSL